MLIRQIYNPIAIRKQDKISVRMKKSKQISVYANNITGNSVTNSK